MRRFTFACATMLLSVGMLLNAHAANDKLPSQIARLGELQPKVETRYGKAAKVLNPVAPADKAALYKKDGFTIEVQFQVKTAMVIDLKFYKDDHADIQGCDILVDESHEFSVWKRDPDTRDFAHWTRQDGRAFADYRWDSHVLHIWKTDPEKLNKGTK